MENKRWLLSIMFSLLVWGGFTQGKSTAPLPLMDRDHTLWIPELDVDSVFMLQLDSILFSAISKWSNQGHFSESESKSNKYFHISFRREEHDSAYMDIFLERIPPEKAVGYLQRGEYFYFFDGDIPPDIMLSKRRMKWFSFILKVGIYDPPSWELVYNPKTGCIEVKNEYW